MKHVMVLWNKKHYFYLNVNAKTFFSLTSERFQTGAIRVAVFFFFFFFFFFSEQYYHFNTRTVVVEGYNCKSNAIKGGQNRLFTDLNKFNKKIQPIILSLSLIFFSKHGIKPLKHLLPTSDNRHRTQRTKPNAHEGQRVSREGPDLSGDPTVRLSWSCCQLTRLFIVSNPVPSLPVESRRNFGAFLRESAIPSYFPAKLRWFER